MKRPLIWFSAAFTAGTAVALFSFSLPLAMAVLVLALAVIFGSRFSQLRPVCVLAAGLACGLSYTTAYHTYVVNPVAEVAGTPATITFTATDYAVQYDNNQRVAVHIKGSDVGCSRSFRTLVYLPFTEEEIQPGDIITASVEFYLSNASEGFDRAGYYRSEGYYVLASAAEGIPITVTQPEHRPLIYYPKKFAHTLQAVFAQCGTERQAAFWSALVTGNRTNLTTKDTDHLRRAGLSHVIALSGLHVGFLISMLMFLFGKKLGTMLCVPALVVFYFMVGWSPSVLRACIMYSMIILAFWVRKQNNSLNALFAALLVILVLLPEALASVSLQLSFASSFGIICFSNRVQKLLQLPKKAPHILKKLYHIFLGSIICTICSSALTVPFLLYHFGYISVFSIFSNLLALWVIAILFPLLVIGGIIGTQLAGISGPILTAAGYLTDYIYWVSDTIANIPYGVLYCESSIDFAISIVLSVITVLLLWLAGKRLLLVSVPALMAAIIGISLWRGAAAADDLKISILPEGSGQAIIVSCGEHAALIDCSGSGHYDVVQDIEQYLDWHGMDSLDLMILTSVDLTHARNVCELLETVPVEQVILPETNRETNEVYPVLMETLENLSISYEKTAPDAETPIGDVSLGISVLGAVERKLMVHIVSEDQDILIVHALTQKMLLDYTENSPLSCDTLVVAGGFVEDSTKMKELLDRIQPEQLILENGWTSPDIYDNIPVSNPYETGEIDFITVRNAKGG
ncbi:MAG: ComEC/Rec2 family competence protein [Clostridia bacterium]|nr:ComEC/Rec2 family competence protein [Clostridia bacterium]